MSSKVKKTKPVDTDAYIKRLEESNADIIAHANALSRELEIERKVCKAYRTLYESQLQQGLRQVSELSVMDDVDDILLGADESIVQ